MTRLAAIALGSNLGDRAGNIARAAAELRRLPRSRFMLLSASFRTAPVAVAPGVDPGGPYLNAAATIQTDLEPEALLQELHAIERDLGRLRDDPTNAQSHGRPRLIDLDLLLVGELTRQGPAVMLPHPGIVDRLFVLEPLAQIAPEMVIPGAGLTVAGALAALLARRPGAGTSAEGQP